MLEAEIELPRRPFAVKLQLSVRPREIYGLFGPSAAGKTSVLSVLAGWERRSRSTVLWRGTVWESAESGPRIPPWRRPLGYAAQDGLLFPHKTVRENIQYGLPLRAGRESIPFGPRTADHAPNQGDFDAIVDELGLREVLDLYPARLSGGLAQRVSFARALARQPEVLLLDEPFSALDVPLRRDLQEFLARIARERSLAVILVTHDWGEVERLAAKAGVLVDGRLVQTGTPEDITRAPSTMRVARLVGYGGFLRDGPGWRAVHPERVRLGRRQGEGISVRATVERTYSEGGRPRALLSVDGDRFEAVLPEPWRAGTDPQASQGRGAGGSDGLQPVDVTVVDAPYVEG